MIRALLAALVVALAASASAAAKGPLEVEICGPTACMQLGDSDGGAALTAAMFAATLDGTAVPDPAPYYEIRQCREQAHQCSVVGYLVPGADVVRVLTRRAWIPSPVALRQAIDVDALPQPYPVPAVVAVTVEEAAVSDPARYGDAFGPLAPAGKPPFSLERIPIDVIFATPTAWLSHGETTTLYYVPSRDALLRDGRWLHATDRLAAAVESDAGLDPGPASRAGRGGLGIAVAVGVGIAALAAATLLTLLAERRHRQRLQT